MAAQQVTVLKASLKNRAGALFNVMAALKSKNVGLTGLWGFSKSGGKADLFVVAKNPAKARAILKKARIYRSEMKAFSVKGKDRAGALNSTLGKLGRKRVNINAVHAIAVGGKFGSYILVNSGSVTKAARALRGR